MKFLTKRYSGHLECTFDKPAEKFLRKVLKSSAQKYGKI